MRKAALILLFLSIPAFAQDDGDYQPRPRKLSQDEQQRSVKCPPNMRHCVQSSATPIPEKDKEGTQKEWQARVKAHGNKPVVVPKPREEKQEAPTLTQSLRVDGNPVAGVALVVCVGAAIYGAFLLAQRKGK